MSNDKNSDTPKDSEKEREPIKDSLPDDFPIKDDPTTIRITGSAKKDPDDED